LATARKKYGLLDIFFVFCLSPAHAITYVSLSVTRLLRVPYSRNHHINSFLCFFDKKLVVTCNLDETFIGVV